MKRQGLGARQSREWRSEQRQAPAILERASSSDAVYIALALPAAAQPSNSGSVHTSSAASVFFSTSMASLGSYHDSEGKVSFSRRPPAPFDVNFVGCERQSDDTNEDWLPDLKDIISGNYSVLIDLTGDLDSEVCHHRGHKSE